MSSSLARNCPYA
ncbi:hypothetical protein FOXB_17011 [Fusarium oxysporum f. sp. conglutinans Fo5176]|uniref:Uncharacterized protein n=1 Tax=Fusarium oxysporum (strain Fo5176) TaxID=660025 RepID=F9GEC7_FUSOF|nr:hypothetical protein FOXB_17011 [Fusarium oxysporum f. sp. conglutinans Fo5176]